MPGDLVFIWAPPRGDSFIIRIIQGSRQDTRLGQILHDNLIGKPYGSWIYTNLGKPFCLLRPNIRSSAGGSDVRPRSFTQRTSGSSLYP